MGLIEIRHRSERLGNLGGVREADVHTGAARVLAGMADVTAQDGRSDRALAGVVPGLLDGAKKIALDFAVAQERRDNEMADRYVARYQQGMDAYNNGSVDVGGKRVPGAMETDFDDSGEWLASNVTYRDRFGARLGKELKMSDRAMEIAKKRLVSYDLHMQNRWQGRAAQVDDARARAAANENFNAQRATALDVLVDGDHAGGAPVALALDDYSQALERALDAAHVPAEARPEARRKAALQFCQEAFARRLRRCEEEALAPESATEDSVKDSFRGLEDAVLSDGWKGVFPFVAARAGSGTGDEPPKGGDGADVLRAHLEGADMEAFASAALKDLKTVRARALHEADARHREAERKTLDGINLASREALADGSLGSIEDALGRMNVEADRHPKESRVRVAALEASRRLDAAADLVATRDCWNAILDHAGDKEPWTPPKGTRMARHYKRLKDSYDRQAQAYIAEGLLMADAAETEMRKANEVQLRTALLGAGATSPGVVAGQLAQAAANGQITLDQYNRLRKEHESVWAQKGMSAKAADLVKILKDSFFFGSDYDPTATMGVNAKTGKFEYFKDPATNKPYPGQNAEWEVGEQVKGEAPSLWLASFGLGLGPLSPYLVGWALPSAHDRTVTNKRTLTSDEQLRLLDWAMDLARLDGTEVNIHPRTGERLDKPLVLDAAAEFSEACKEILVAKDAEAAQARVARLAGALRDINIGAAKRERLLGDVVGTREEVRSEAKSALRQQKRRPFAPKMPGAGPLAGAAEDEAED